MIAFTPDQWLVLLLTFVLGLILGMALLASPKWKRLYRDEARRRAALETEIEQLRRDAREMDSLRNAAVRDEERRRADAEPAPLSPPPPAPPAPPPPPPPPAPPAPPSPPSP
jgi:hypothetical protein